MSVIMADWVASVAISEFYIAGPWFFIFTECSCSTSTLYFFLYDCFLFWREPFEIGSIILMAFFKLFDLNCC